MPATLYVLGHKNPDTDAICAAVGYAALLQAQGHSHAVAARQGAVRRETGYVLERFGLAEPPLVTDVRPRVADVMTSPAPCVHLDTSLYEVGALLQRHDLRAVPVVDDAGRLCGVSGVADFAQAFVAGLDLPDADPTPLPLENLRRALEGQMLVPGTGGAVRHHVVVGGMSLAALRRVAPDAILVLGDRADAQCAAIRCGVGALVVTGDAPIDAEVLDLARASGVAVITTPHHTYTAARRIQLSLPVRQFMRREVATCRADDLVEAAQATLRNAAVPSLVVLREDGTVAGLVDRTALLGAVRRQVVLVDHNERGQAVTGIEEAEIVGVVDHHRVADFQTRVPPLMRVEPVGATSTIVAKLWAEAALAMPAPLAGVLLAGILADTLHFRGPTTTADDRAQAARLAAHASVDADDLGQQILALASDIADRTAEELLLSDFKEFGVGAQRFGISVIETTNAAAVLARRGELRDAMGRLRAQGYTSLLCAVIDLLHEETVVLVAGHAAAVAATFGGVAEEDTLRLPGIRSRKKDLVPLLGPLSQRIAGQ